jgi:hypothetical protein
MFESLILFFFFLKIWVFCKNLVKNYNGGLKFEKKLKDGYLNCNSDERSSVISKVLHFFFYLHTYVYIMNTKCSN